MLNAVETVESKNKELERIIARLSADKSQSVNPLSMILNGVIDAAVMGGIAKYEEVRYTYPPFRWNHSLDTILSFSTRITPLLSGLFLLLKEIRTEY